MEIRLANNSDIPGMIELLKQVGEVHHKIRPDRMYSASSMDSFRVEPGWLDMR